ncbi:MAG: valine--tRNA ligase [Thermodesulfobacteriota bacterium]|nr:valine--tRNA ligase [Thermodesulfobacteriota bacterium]
MNQKNKNSSQPYSHKEIEPKWLESITQNTTLSSEATYSVAIPPPNVTGNLHLGHALNTTIQDILVKFNSLNGLDVRWTPGTDHAGIATQLLVERSLNKKKIKTKDMTRDELLNHIWEWKKENGNSILEQLRKLGLSCSWNNIKFTLDDDLSNSVNEAFIRLFDKGLIYREKTLVNWDIYLKTAISDLEVISETRKTKLYYFKYGIKDSNDFITVSTTRPETVFGDVAVAVNPKDDLRKKFIGKTILSPFTNKELVVIEDEYADIEKGSGALKITPAHDFNDYEIAKNHNLKLVNILNDDGTLNSNTPTDFQNLTVLDARKKVLELMKELDIYVKEEDIKNVIPVGDRSGVVIEPLLKDQWFLNVEKMAIQSKKAVEDEKIIFKPKFWENTFFEWMENIQPWCISRQIIWGHRIPIWKNKSNDKYVAAKNIDEAKNKYQEKYKEIVELTQESDVLDTWFSSGLWPFSTLGWPNESEDYNKYFPTTILVTGFDIIFFWVARMIMMSLELTQKIPFKTVYIHNLIRDGKGDKMSKTKGNVIDPLTLIDKYGTDSLRFYLSSNISPHSDIKLSNSSLEPYKNFMNKIWNAGNFVILNKGNDTNYSNTTFYDSWIINEFNNLLTRYNHHLENCEVEKAAYSIYHFFWDEFCDWYIEIAKISLTKLDEDVITNSKTVMKNIYLSFINLLYPFCPFISLELKEKIEPESKNKIFQKLPQKLNHFYSGDYESEIQLIKDFTNGVRSLRKNLMIQPKDKIVAYYSTNSKNYEFLVENKFIIESLCNLQSFNLLDENSELKLISNVTSSGSISFEKSSKHNFSKQILKLNKDLVSLEKSLNLTKSKLENKGFLDSAPEDIVNEEKLKETSISTTILEIKDLIFQLEN